MIADKLLALRKRSGLSQQEVAAAIGVTAFPTTLFIAPDGSLTAYAISMLDAETLQRGIDMLLDSAA